MKLLTTKDYLLLIDEEAEIKYNCIIFESDTCLINVVGKGYVHNKTDFKIIAYYPLTKEAKELDLPLLPNPFDKIDIYVKKESYEKELIKKGWDKDIAYNMSEGYLDALEEIQSKQFSLEDMKKAIEMAQSVKDYGDYKPYSEQEIIQSLSTQQLPKEFIPEFDIVHTDHAPNGFEKVLKFKTNSEGKEVLVGTYKY